jgi:REP element-mobilizing transposase RayT
MARPLRIVCPGAWYHVTARGNERRDIFRDDKDRFHFLETLGEMTVRFDVRIHAYVLMGNHYHLLLELRQANLSQAVQWLNVSYSVWFNRRHRRSGHLFQGRFKSIVVEPRAWGVGLSAYIHLNPVRVSALGLSKARRQQARAVAMEEPDEAIVAGRLETLRAYRWSSYKAYTRAARRPAWLECATVLEMGGGKAAQRVANYRRYVENQLREGLPQSPWEALTDRVLLGGADFLRKVRASLSKEGRARMAPKSIRQPASFREVVAAVEKARGEKWEEFRERHGDAGRDQVLYLARRATALSLADLAKAAKLNQHATVVMAIKRYEKRARKEPEKSSCRRAADLLQITM